MQKHCKNLQCVFGFMLTAFYILYAPSSYSTIFEANYTPINNNRIDFRFTGKLMEDGDTIVIERVLGVPAYNGASPDLGSVHGHTSATDSFNTIGPDDAVVVPATVTFSGHSMDIVYYNDFPGEGFFIGPASGSILFNSTLSYGGFIQVFSPSRWSVAVYVPLPPGIFLLPAAFLATFLLSKRSRNRAA